MTKYHFPKIPKIDLKSFQPYKTKDFDPKNLRPSYDPESHYKWHEEQENKHNEFHDHARDAQKAELHRLTLNYHNECYTWHSSNFSYMIAENFKDSTTPFGKKEYQTRLKEAKSLDAVLARMEHSRL